MKKLLFIILTFVLCLSACNKNDSVDKDNSGNNENNGNGSNSDNSNKSIIFDEISAPEHIYPADLNNIVGTTYTTNTWEFTSQIPYNSILGEKPGFFAEQTMTHDKKPNVTTLGSFAYQLVGLNNKRASYLALDKSSKTGDYTESNTWPGHLYVDFGVLLASNKRTTIKPIYSIYKLMVGARVVLKMYGAVFDKNHNVIKKADKVYTYSYTVKPRSEMPTK